MKKKFDFAGVDEFTLNVTEHVMQRVAERLYLAFPYNEMYLDFFAKILGDPRLEDIVFEVPINSNVVVYSKMTNLYIFFVITLDEVHVKTVICRSKKPVATEPEDYRFILPYENEDPMEACTEDGKIFVTKKRELT